MAESEKAPTQEQLHEALFAQLVLMFQGAAMQAMGKVMNPITQKVERDLDHAKHSVDMLGMLEAKTKGNLTEHESSFLTHTLFELRMNYVDEVKRSQEEEKKEEGEKEEEGEEEKEEEGTARE